MGLRDPEWRHRVDAILESASPPAYDGVIADAKTKASLSAVPRTVEIASRIPRSAATKVSQSALVAGREG